MDVHKTYYRAMSDTIERVKIAKLLLVQDRGAVGQNHGRNIDDISLEGKCYIISYGKV